MDSPNEEQNFPACRCTARPQAMKHSTLDVKKKHTKTEKVVLWTHKKTYLKKTNLRKYLDV